MSRICRYTLEMHRSSDLEGTFLVSDEEFKALSEDISGNNIHYGEIAGKHSDVNADFDINDLEVLSESEDDAKFFLKLFPSGKAGFGFKYFLLEDFIERVTEEGYESWSDYDSIDEAIQQLGYSGIAAKAFAEGYFQKEEEECKL